MVNDAIAWNILIDSVTQHGVMLRSFRCQSPSAALTGRGKYAQKQRKMYQKMMYGMAVRNAPI